MRAIRRFTVRPVLPEPLAPLAALAGNLRWSWHQGTRAVLRAVEPRLWDEVGHDPVRLLGSVPGTRLDELAGDAGFLAALAAAHADLEHYLHGDRWYQRQQAAGRDLPRAIGYFSPEFGVAAVLPQYSGGLGILAGDHLKAASDLGVPVVGVGLLYRQGYFRQSLSREGWQQEGYPVVDPDGLPVTLLREADGSGARVRVDTPGGVLVARVWVAHVGRVPLLMLDSDVEDNPEPLRQVTDRLYGGTAEHRLLQELLLGVGGVRALRLHARLSGRPDPEVFHTNEGHAGFLGVERLRELTAEDAGPRLDLDTALEVCRAGTVFTTHTPVPAGIDRFPRELVAQYLGGAASPVPGVPVERVLALGAEDHEGGDPGVFNMAVMGLRLAQRANGVSRLHGRVSRAMFRALWPAFEEAEVPIGAVTNGVHAGTWVAPELLELLALARATGTAPAGHRGDGTEDGGGVEDVEDVEGLFGAVDQVDPATLWTTKRRLRARLVEDARRRLRASCLERGAAPSELTWTETALDPDVLTIGFARRVPSYKRLTLMLRDPERLKRLLLDPERPVQLVVAGKAHPADDGGKRLVQEMVRFADDPEVRHRIAFLPDYDIAMALPLYPGCDVWLNNPLRPYEACGTSGMKAALNGGLNVSVLDGWWDEWYDGSNGWAIPSADVVADADHRDDLEAGALYDLLEREVAPRFYDVDDHGVPARWIEMVRHTLRSLGPGVLASRMVRDYVDRLYAPAAASARAVGGDHGAARALAQWKARVRGGWDGVRVEHVESHGVPEVAQVGDTVSVRAFVALGGLRPEDVRVELVHGRPGDADDLVETTAEELSPGESWADGRHRYDGSVRLVRSGPFGYTVRVLPRHPLLASPAELGLVALPC